MIRFDAFAELHPKITLKKGKHAAFIDMAALPQHGRDIFEVSEKPFKGSGSKFQNGDTLIARITPCLENGKGALVRCLDEGRVAFGSTEFIVARAIRPSDQNFVYYVTRSEQFREIAIARMEGTSGRQRVSWQQLASIKIPKLTPEQREQIGLVLASLDDKIELNRKTSATLEEMARALYRSWFVDFDPVHAKVAGRAPAHMDAQTASLFPDSFGEDGLPEGWEWSTVSAVCEHVKQTVKPMGQADQLFHHFSLPAFDAKRVPAAEHGKEIRSNKCFVPNNAVLFSRLNPSIPRVWWAQTNEETAIPAASTEFYVAKALQDSQTPWLYCLMSSAGFRDEALFRVTGTSNSHQRVPPTTFADIEVIKPTDNFLHAFGDICGNWFERGHAMSKENQTLAALRDTLLPRLMSGELRVGEARQQVEEHV